MHPGHRIITLAAAVFLTGFTAVYAAFNAFEIVEAEACQDYYNLGVTRRNLGHVEKGAWAKYEDVDFTRAPSRFFACYTRPEVPDGYRIAHRTGGGVFCPFANVYLGYIQR